MAGKSAVMALLLVALAAGAMAGGARVLTDETFEHDTQVTSGATTGDWFIEFYAPWCGHCKQLAPIWDELADDLKGELNVAKVDCVDNHATCQRFGVRGYPTLVFFHNGQMYPYQGPRDLASLRAFAVGGYEAAEPTAVPEIPHWVYESIAGVESKLNKYMEMLQSLERKYELDSLVDNPTLNAIIIGFILAGIILVPVIVLMCVCMCLTSDSAKPAARQPAASKAAATAPASAKKEETPSQEAGAEVSGGDRAEKTTKRRVKAAT